MLNPNNEIANVIVHSGKNIEKFYDVDSYQVKQIPQMLSWLSFFGFVCMSLAVPLINKKEEVVTKKINPHLLKLSEYLHEDFIDKTEDPNNPTGIQDSSN